MLCTSSCKKIMNEVLNGICFWFGTMDDAPGALYEGNILTCILHVLLITLQLHITYCDAYPVVSPKHGIEALRLDAPLF